MRRYALALVLLALGCVDGSALLLPTAPLTSQAALLVRSCGDERRFYAASASLSELVFAEPECADGRETWLAYLARSLESLGWSPGPIEPGDCPADPGPCCVERRLSGLTIDGLYHSERGEILPEDTVAEWPVDLGALRIPSACRCLGLELAGATTLLGARRIDLGLRSPTELGILMSRVYEPDPPAQVQLKVSYHRLPLASVPTGSSELNLPEQPGFDGYGRSLDHGPEGRFAAAASGPEILLGEDVGAHSQLIGADPNRQYIAVRLRPGPEPDLHLAALSFGSPTALELHREGRWDDLGAPELMLGTCVKGKTSIVSGQRAQLLWRGPDELLAVPNALDIEAAELPTPTRSPDGFWRLRGERPEWVRGPGLDGDCLSAMTLTAEYGVLFGTSQRGLMRWTESGWERLEPFRWQADYNTGKDIWVIQEVPGGLLYGGREGRISYIQDDVHCGSFTPTAQHLTSAVATQEGYLFATEARGASHAAQILRIRLVP